MPPTSWLSCFIHYIKEYEKSKSECIKARKALGKIEKHEEVWTLFEKRKEEISEEKELEDFKTRNIEY